MLEYFSGEVAKEHISLLLGKKKKQCTHAQLNNASKIPLHYRNSRKCCTNG
jgi:hypothetical protein